MPYLKSLAVTLTVILRIYSNDETFQTIDIPNPGFLPLIKPVKDIQAGLAFARDYDDKGDHTNGRFHVYWKDSVTPEVIAKFKESYKKRGLTPKVYATIGGRGTKYPFQVRNKEEWIKNAVESLTHIVKKYHLDGIDVYYEDIKSTKQEFVDTIGSLIKQLRKNEVITTASIAASDHVNDYYVSLYNNDKDLYDTVVYQCHNEVKRVPDPETLVDRFEKKAVENYGRDKLLAGYSAIYKDWDTVLPIVYFFGGGKIFGFDSIPNILNPSKYSAVGTSIWLVAPVCIEPRLELPTWMLNGMYNVTQALTT